MKTPRHRMAVLNQWRESVIYHIFVDRFAGLNHPELADKPEFAGGTIAGITGKLPYINDLADAVWLSPFQKGVSYHGYHTTEPAEIGETFGTEGDLRTLIGEAHARGMKVICDIVPNHLSVRSYAFQQAIANPRSKYRDWFIFGKYPTEYVTFLGFGDLAKLNCDNPEVIAYLVDSYRKWLHMGMDGFRLDHVIGLSNPQLQALLAPLQSEFPEAIFVGEALLDGIDTPEQIATLRAADEATIRRWMKHPRQCYKHYVGVLDGVLNFEAAENLLKFANTDERAEREIVSRKLRAQTAAFPRSFLLPTMLDNHDMERFLFRAGNDVDRLKAAATEQFGLDQPIVIYYGTDVGMTQHQTFKDKGWHGDLLARQPMIWDETKQNQNLLGFYQGLVAARRERNNHRQVVSMSRKAGRAA